MSVGEVVGEMTLKVTFASFLSIVKRTEFINRCDYAYDGEKA